MPQQVVTAQGLQALRTTYNAVFTKALQNADTSYQKIATVIHSTSSSNTYGNLGALPGFREWIGDRAVKGLSESAYTIFNKTFESTIGIGRDQYEDDNLGLYPMAIQQMAVEGTDLPNDLVYELMSEGFVKTCYDGQPFFDDEHPINTEHDGSGDNAPVSNVITDPDYDGPTWYVLDTRRPLKPLILQMRRALSFTAMFNPTDPNVFTSNEFQFGADMRCNAGFGMWQMAIAIKAPMTRANAWKALHLMASYTRDGGKKLKLRPNMIVAPTTLMEQATKLTERELDVEDGVQVSNELKHKFELLIAPQL